MELSKRKNKQPQAHIASIFKEYTTPSRVLRSFTNLANTVIQTALSGQCKFVFEILQNADDAFEDEHKAIEVQFALQDHFLIVQHNGKGFDCNDVERICDYASQIEEVKATDLRKTGYKGLGFKSLFNLSECIYIHSNGYSFRFDKTYWSDAESKPWQVIPIWCEPDALPLGEKYSYDEPVNFILKVRDAQQLECQLQEIVEQPELLLFMHRIDKLSVDVNGEKHSLERRMQKLGVFNRIDFYQNEQVKSTWLSRTYKRSVPKEVQTIVWGGSRFIFPDKIKLAKKIPLVFAVRCDEALNEILKIRGLCYSTLPTQLCLTLPYHINGPFILNLDRTQLHENGWNAFLLYQLGQLQFNLLKDVAVVDYLKNYVIQLFVREIQHPYATFSKAFLKGFKEVSRTMGWLPPHQGSRLLKLGEAWSDEIEFFKQNFQNIKDHKIYPHLIHYNVRSQDRLLTSKSEARHFSYEQLFAEFNRYYVQLTRSGYINFITYLYERLKSNPTVSNKLKSLPFLKAKDGTPMSPTSALLEEYENPIPDFVMLNPVDNDYLPSNDANSIKEWLTGIGARRLTNIGQILRQSIMKWMDSSDFDRRITSKRHIEIISFVAKGFDELTYSEIKKIKERLLFLTEGGQYNPANACYLPDVVSVAELADVIAGAKRISSSYDLKGLRRFFIQVGVHDVVEVTPISMLRSVLDWMKSGEINKKLTISNYTRFMECVAEYYLSSEYHLTQTEKTEFQRMPVLTCGQVFNNAIDCYFLSAVSDNKGLEIVIENYKLVDTGNLSDSIRKFFIKIGVKERMSPVELIEKSVFKWILEGQIMNRITKDNHLSILQFIAEHWFSNYEVRSKYQIHFKRFPIWTKSETFREANKCFFSTDPKDCESNRIPMLDTLMSSDEYVSLEYDTTKIKRLLGDLGVHKVGFTDIYEKYCDHLTCDENVEWFFSKLMEHWGKNPKDDIFSRVQQKFNNSSLLLAKNNKMYHSAELYSSQFESIHDIDPNALPLLKYGKLPKDLERFLGFRMALDLKCIKQLLKAFGKKLEEDKKRFGGVKTRILFSTLLEELQKCDHNKIKQSQLSLLSEDNTLKPAKDLYYFTEKDAHCVLSSCYLKRIDGMTHEDTLELATLCGVNTLPFSKDVQRENETCDNTLKEFYVTRLPFFVLQDSKRMNEDPTITLRRLYEATCGIELYECNTIHVKYAFGYPTNFPYYFDDLSLYVVGKWTKRKTKIHKHLKERLGLKTDTDDIIDMESFTEGEIEEWLHDKNENKQKYYSIEAQLKELLSNEGNLPSVDYREVDHLHCRDIEKNLSGSTDNEELIANESSSDKMSFKSVQYKPVQTQLKEVGALSNTSTGSIDEDNIEADSFLREIELGLQREINKAELSLIESTKVYKPLSSYKEKPATQNNDMIFSDSSSAESSEDCIEHKPRLQTQHMRDEIGVVRTFIGEPNDFTSHDTIYSENIIARRLVRSEYKMNRKRRIEPGMSDSSLKSRRIGSSGDLSREKFLKQRLGEKYVFAFLQEHYKKKYPDSEFSLSDETFRLQWQSFKMEVVWLNAKEEKGRSHDLVVKKDGEVKWLIEVQSSIDEGKKDSFKMRNRKFIKKINEVEKEHKAKFCVYRVFNANSSAKESSEALGSPALYKVVPLKNS